MPEPHDRGSSEDEAAHDVLAAEAFAVPGPDPALSHRPVTLPEDPSGIAEPHDILAAEEFAMPAGPRARAGAVATASRRPRRVRLAAAALLARLGVGRRRRD